MKKNPPNRTLSVDEVANGKVEQLLAGDSERQQRIQIDQFLEKDVFIDQNGFAIGDVLNGGATEQLPKSLSAQARLNSLSNFEHFFRIALQVAVNEHVEGRRRNVKDFQAFVGIRDQFFQRIDAEFGRVNQSGKELIREAEVENRRQPDPRGHQDDQWPTSGQKIPAEHFLTGIDLCDLRDLCKIFLTRIDLVDLCDL